MQDPFYSILLFVILGASAALGFFVHWRLPERHRTPQSIALVQLAITLLVTFTAIVLGLLTTSVKAGFDEGYAARGNDAAKLAELYRCLRDYGPETAEMRGELRSYVAAVIASTWPDEPRPTGVDYPDTAQMPRTGEAPVLGDILSRVGYQIRSLEPKDDLHTRLLSECVDQHHELLDARWRVIEGKDGSISAPFYWVLVFWLAILFGAFGLTAAPNPMVVTVVTLCALSVTVAVFVILDMDEPYGGLFGIPSTSMRNAFADMSR